MQKPEEESAYHAKAYLGTINLQNLPSAIKFDLSAPDVPKTTGSVYTAIMISTTRAHLPGLRSDHLLHNQLHQLNRCNPRRQLYPQYQLQLPRQPRYLHQECLCFPSYLWLRPFRPCPFLHRFLPHQKRSRRTQYQS